MKVLSLTPFQACLLNLFTYPSGSELPFPTQSPESWGFPLSASLEDAEMKQDEVVHSCSPSTPEAEVGVPV